MAALLTVTFSTLKGAAIAVAAVNLAVIAAAIVCLYFLQPPKGKRATAGAKAPKPRKYRGKNVECTLFALPRVANNKTTKKHNSSVRPPK